MNYLDKVLERASKATSGPWDADSCSRYHSNSNGPDEYEVGPSTFECKDYHKGFGLEPEQARLDAVFIAASRTDVVILAERLKRVIKYLREHVIEDLNSPNLARELESAPKERE